MHRMARVQVLAATPTDGGDAMRGIFYAAQIFEDNDDAEPVWTCIHEHRTTVSAQLCGVQFLTDRLLGRARRETT